MEQFSDLVAPTLICLGLLVLIFLYIQRDMRLRKERRAVALGQQDLREQHKLRVQQRRKVVASKPASSSSRGSRGYDYDYDCGSGYSSSDGGDGGD